MITMQLWVSGKEKVMRKAFEMMIGTIEMLNPI